MKKVKDKKFASECSGCFLASNSILFLRSPAPDNKNRPLHHVRMSCFLCVRVVCCEVKLRPDAVPFPLLCSAVIEPCLDSELKEFPLRMRDWLKNVLVTLYERDEDNNLLTEKQKLRVSGRRGNRAVCSVGNVFQESLRAREAL